MIRRRARSTLTDTLVPYTTLVLSPGDLVDTDLVEIGGGEAPPGLADRLPMIAGECRRHVVRLRIEGVARRRQAVAGAERHPLRRRHPVPVARRHEARGPAVLAVFDEAAVGNAEPFGVEPRERGRQIFAAQFHLELGLAGRLHGRMALLGVAAQPVSHHTPGPITMEHTILARKT